MSKIFGKDTKPEILVRKHLFSKGFRYRINDKRYPGKPDIILPKYKTAIFIHGCFWHGHSCKRGKLPETNREFWENKINNTKIRDKRNKRELEVLGWNVITIWQCEIRSVVLREEKLSSIVEYLKSSFSANS
jgi:DNA mismatch endonuclease (patch repair protein)